jgi:diguanylate cyclase (GGDEF)-like protein
VTMDSLVSGNSATLLDTDETAEDSTSSRGALARLVDWRPGFGIRAVTLHRVAGQAAASETLGYQRVLLVVRSLGVVVLAIVTAVSATGQPLLVAAAAVPLVATIAIQVTWLRRERTVASWRAVAFLGLVSDGLTAVLAGQAFITNPDWVGFISYSLIALEAAIFFGLGAALATTGVLVAAYLGQVAERAAIGIPSSRDSVAAVVLVLFVNAVFVGAYGRVNRRVRGDLATLLGLSALLARQESPTRIVQALDGYLRTLVGARVRSVALSRADGGYDIVRWHTPETRVIPANAVTAIARAAGRDLQREFGERRAVTLAIEPDRDAMLVAAMGLPAWVRSVTLVPIPSDGAHGGILPVLWDTRRLPTDGELDLLHGLADQTGIAFAQAQLRRARELAATDSLTGLANHRAFQDLLGRHITDVRARGGQLAILFCDLDRFKSVNDPHGHAVGDLLLHRIAQAVMSVARSADVVARYGGDEIALVLPGAGREVAIEVAQRLRQEVRAAENGMGVDLTVGVAVYPEDATTQEDLLARADAAMYAGKRRGGARVVHAGELPAEG